MLTPLALVAGAWSCGGQAERDAAEAGERRQAIERVTRERKLERLRKRLRERKAALKAERRRKARRSAREVESTKRGGGDAERSFEQLARELGGELGVAIGPPGAGAATSFGALQAGPAWSTIKVPIALRVLGDVGGPGGLSTTQKEQIRSALTFSDNAAAAALFAYLERHHGGLAGASWAVEEVLREGGDYGTTVSTQGRGEFSTYGQTEWSLEGQERFMSALAAGCVVSPESARYVLDLMGEVSSDAWGLGSAGVPARWKGGWGPGVDGRYLVRQMGTISIGDREAVATLMVRPGDGQFSTAQSMATSVADWLTRQAPRYARAPHGC